VLVAAAARTSFACGGDGTHGYRIEAPTPERRRDDGRKRGKRRTIARRSIDKELTAARPKIQ